ncbi:hypothetical protein M2454_000638 [Aequitasia blattaphilus]|uniref:YcxB family protein n=1 Tax=Aequitasia blattaphilus TaxID=2949332 RepID=A0ABT1ECD5_9FIRM|nr:YcxB family protein [Aequitasia blattaphilus]MCP1102142.1 YcxB family protein [Aequitasia blattaphilus]MCR8614782.1 YcxB family protein [Aequitasia blattaphilus]
MVEKISVKLSKKELFDFLLYHTYSKPMGLFVNVLGMAVVFSGCIMLLTGKISVIQFALYIAAAVLFLGYTPITLKHKAKKEIEKNKIYHQEWNYEFDDSGIRISYDENSKFYPWEDMKRMVTTPQTIGLYYEEDNALIIPKKDFNDKFLPIIHMVVDHLGLQNVRFR